MTFDLESADKGFWMGVHLAKTTAEHSNSIEEFLDKLAEETSYEV